VGMMMNACYVDAPRPITYLVNLLHIAK